MKNERIANKIGTFAAVGATSIAGAALWTYVLQGEFLKIQERITKPKGSNIIDFKKARRKLSR